MDSALQQFIQVEEQKQHIQNLIFNLAERCWDTCMDGHPQSKMSRGNESCLRNCVDRFVDTNLMVARRLDTKASQLMPKDGL